MDIEKKIDQLLTDPKHKLVLHHKKHFSKIGILGVALVVILGIGGMSALIEYYVDINLSITVEPGLCYSDDEIQSANAENFYLPFEIVVVGGATWNHTFFLLANENLEGTITVDFNLSGSTEGLDTYVLDEGHNIVTDASFVAGDVFQYTLEVVADPMLISGSYEVDLTIVSA